MSDVLDLFRSARASEDVHTHRCDRCGASWSHPDSTLLESASEFRRAHCCPACGRAVFAKAVA